MYYSPFNQFQNYSIRQESITRVTGEEGAKAYQMAPNSSAALFDGNEDIFYLKTTDGAGFPTIRKFKFEEIQAKTPEPAEESDYITREEFEQFRTVSQLMEWIRTAGENPVPYLIALAYPDSDIIDGLDDEGIAKGYETISRNLSARDKKSLYYIFGGDHGSDPHCVIQLILTHLHTPLWDRIGSAQHIVADYELNKAIGRIPETGFNPNLNMIEEAIKRAIKSTMEGKNDYTLEAPQEPKK